MESSLGNVSHLSVLIEDLDLDCERSQEIVTVSCIFPELTLLSPHSFYILLPISPIPPLSVTFSDDSTSTVTRTLNHLPPLKLTVSLPESYPLESPPNIRLESSWVAKDVLIRLHGELLKLWEEIRDQVLYAVIDHLIQAAEVAFQKKIGAESLILPKSLEEELILFNKRSLKEVFEKGTYECGVCLGMYTHCLFLNITFSLPLFQNQKRDLFAIDCFLVTMCSVSPALPIIILPASLRAMCPI